MSEMNTTQAAPRLSMAEAEVRRARYLPFVLPWTEIDPSPRALDLDCGAGGWLRLLEAAGFNAEGREDDPDMRATALTSGFSVAPHGEDFLSGIDDASLSVLSAFEMLNRHPPEEIVARLPDMLRVLRPGGILIVGGENAEHPRARYARSGAEKIAAHLRREGPGRLSIVRTEGTPPGHPGAVGLAEVFSGMGLEAAVVFQREAKEVAFDRFHAAFAADLGLSPDGLVARFDARHRALEEQILRLERRIEEQNLRLERRITEQEDAQRAEVEALRHVTRRRGLRRWLHERKMARKTNNIPTARDVETGAAEAPSSSSSFSPPPVPSMRPLSQRMRALRDRLTK